MKGNDPRPDELPGNVLSARQYNALRRRRGQLPDPVDPIELCGSYRGAVAVLLALAILTTVTAAWAPAVLVVACLVAAGVPVSVYLIASLVGVRDATHHCWRAVWILMPAAFALPVAITAGI
jgi:hypothetical protein